MEEEVKYEKQSYWQQIVLYLVVGGIIYAGVYYFFLKKNPSSNYNGSIQKTRSAAVNQNVSSQNQSVVSTPETKLEITGNEFAYNPSTIQAKVGKPLEITFKNSGNYPHDFSIPQMNVQSKVLSPGQQETLLVTPTKTGTFAFMCTIPGHVEKGMKGTLNVY